MMNPGPELDTLIAEKVMDLGPVGTTKLKTEAITRSRMIG